MPRHAAHATPPPHPAADLYEVRITRALKSTTEIPAQDLRDAIEAVMEEYALLREEHAELHPPADLTDTFIEQTPYDDVPLNPGASLIMFYGPAKTQYLRVRAHLPRGTTGGGHVEITADTGPLTITTTGGSNVIEVSGP